MDTVFEGQRMKNPEDKSLEGVLQNPPQNLDKDKNGKLYLDRDTWDLLDRLDKQYNDHRGRTSIVRLVMRLGASLVYEEEVDFAKQMKDRRAEAKEVNHIAQQIIQDFNISPDTKEAVSVSVRMFDSTFEMGKFFADALNLQKQAVHALFFHRGMQASEQFQQDLIDKYERKYNDLMLDVRSYDILLRGMAEMEDAHPNWTLNPKEQARQQGVL